MSTSEESGDFPPPGPGDAHIDGDEFVAEGCREGRQKTGARFYGDVAVLSCPLLEQEPGDAARGVAAGHHFRTVGIEDAHGHLGAGLRRREQSNHLVAADPEMAVGQPPRARLRQGKAARPAVQNDEIVAEPVHLPEAGWAGRSRGRGLAVEIGHHVGLIGPRWGKIQFCLLSGAPVKKTPPAGRGAPAGGVPLGDPGVRENLMGWEEEDPPGR